LLLYSGPVCLDAYCCRIESRMAPDVSVVAERCINVSGDEPPVLSLVVTVLLGLFGAQAVIVMLAISSSAAAVLSAFILCCIRLMKNFCL
jgi:hypothetical protein